MPDSKITALTALTAADPANDMIPIVDVSDTPPASGNTKRISINNILAASGTATLASATITGALDAARLNVTGATIPANGVYLGSANNLSFSAASTLGMTLNATGLGVGQSPTAPLHIYSAATGTGPITNVVGTFRTGAAGRDVSLQFSDTANQAYVTMLSGALLFGTGGATERVRIDTVGNVGIGVTPTAIFSGSGVNGKGLQGDSWTISSFGGSNDTYFGSNLYTSAYGVWSNRVNAASGAYYITGGTHIFYRGAAQAPGTITPTESARIDASGNLILQPSSTPPSLFANGQLTMNATSNTNLRFSYRGSDGVTRVANITLA